MAPLNNSSEAARSEDDQAASPHASSLLSYVFYYFSTDYTKKSIDSGNRCYTVLQMGEILATVLPIS